MKRLLTISLTLVVAMTMSFVSFDLQADAATKITAAKAKSIALKNCKLTKSKVRGLKAEFDDGVYEVEFTRKSNGAEIGFEISKTGKILKKSVDYRYKATASKKKIGKAKARKIAAKYSKVKLATVKKGSCVFKSKKRGSKYEVKFKSGKYRYEYEILARNGQLIEYDWKLVK